MKDLRKITINLLTVCFLFTAVSLIGGCSILSSTVDVITWAPKKLWSVTGDKMFGVHNEQQTDMGPRRKPSGNPQGGSMPVYPSIPSAMSQENPMGMMPRSGAYPPPAMPMPQGGGQAGYPMPNPYGSGTTPQGMGAMPQSQYGGGLPVMPQMPPAPYGNKAMSPYMSEGLPEIRDPSDTDVGADAAYAGGNGGGGQKKSWWKSIPFISGNYKMERRYEPLAADFVVANDDLPPIPAEEEKINSNDSVLHGTPWRKSHKPTSQNTDEIINKEKSKRSASMFPIEKYAPKPTATVQKIENKEISDKTYPKLGRIPENPKNLTGVDAAAAELDTMIKEAEQAEAKKAVIHNLQTPTNDSSVDGGGNSKIVETPERPSESESKTISPEEKTKKTIPLVKRRKENQSNNLQHNSSNISSVALKNDAILIKDITQEDSGNTTETKKHEEPRKGFFASLRDKIFKPSPKTIFRKSEPPVVASNSAANSDNFIQADSNLSSERNYDIQQGSLLPKPRYTDRRKVPQN